MKCEVLCAWSLLNCWDYLIRGSVYNSFCFCKRPTCIYCLGSSYCIGCWRMRYRVTYRSVRWRGSPDSCKIRACSVVSGTVSLLFCFSEGNRKFCWAGLDSDSVHLPTFSSAHSPLWFDLFRALFPALCTKVLGLAPLSVNRVSVWEGWLQSPVILGANRRTVENSGNTTMSVHGK